MHCETGLLLEKEKNFFKVKNGVVALHLITKADKANENLLCNRLSQNTHRPLWW